MAIKERIFLVGCPRSGTTLLQSIVAAHPAVASFPESHFFAKLLLRRNRWERLLCLGSQEVNHCIDDFLLDVKREDLRALFPKRYGFTFQYASAFQKALDAIAGNKTIWLEKTPRHLHYIHEIEKWIKGAKFIHITRSGQDVVASMYEVTHKYPDVWQGHRSIEQCVDRWSSDMAISKKYSRKSNHLIVSYENLINDSDSVLRALERFINIRFDASLMMHRASVAQKIILNNEVWKGLVDQPIQPRNARKFYEVFNQDEQKKVLDRLALTHV